MGKLKSFHLIENCFWVLLVGIFFIFSFEFNQEIEIYKFGATGWPRSILVLLAIVTLGNLFHSMTYGEAEQEGRIGLGEKEEVILYESFQDYFKIFAILLGPLIFALLLKPVGFYFLSPFFIIFIILVFGERRPVWILTIACLIYLLLLLMFMILLNAPLPQGNMSPFYDYSGLLLKLNTQIRTLW